MPTDFELPVIKLVTTKRRIEGRCTRGYEYVPHEDPVKEESQFYQDFIKAVELQFGANSEELRVFEMWNKMCKEHVISIGGFTESVRFWFKDHDQLYLKFANTVLPYMYPLATEEEVHLANKFLQSVKAAFPENKKRCYQVALLIVKFQRGKLTLKEMTVKMLELLENRVELIEAYLQFVPQAQNFVPRAQKIRNSTKLFAYPLVAGGLLVLAIALSKMKK